VRVETAFLANVVRDAADLDADTRTALLAAATRTDDSALALYQSVRDMLRRLRPANLDALGLAAALQELCESWAARTGVRCDYRADGDTEALGDEIDITVYRIAQEALTNVTRHARASHVQLSLTRDADDEVILTVQDDGRGMDASVATHGLGLLGAVERAAAVGADLSVASSPGAGVCISLRIALHQAQRIQQQRHEPYSATPTPTPTPTHVHASAEAQWPHAGAAQTATAATAINAINAMIPTAATTATTPADSDLGGAIRTWRRAA
jgi:signal transduction histidine kinase